MEALEDTSESASTFTHDELLKITSSVLKELLSKDTYLSDLHGEVALDEINNQIALLHGKSITVYVVRGEELLSVIVPQGVCKVSDFKRAIKRALTLKLERGQFGPEKQKKISWRHIWKVWNLECGGAILEKDNVLLQDYGVTHKSYVHYVRKRRERNRQYKM